MTGSVPLQSPAQVTKRDPGDGSAVSVSGTVENVHDPVVQASTSLLTVPDPVRLTRKVRLNSAEHAKAKATSKSTVEPKTPSQA